MCGRYALAMTAAQVAELFGVANGLAHWPSPRYNVAPTQLAPVIGMHPGTGKRGVAEMRWGLVPAWADDPGIGGRMINARAETVDSKPSFRDSLQHRRCVVPVSGFYEWRREGDGKQPYYFTLKDEAPMALAGLWAERTEPDGPPLRSFTIITTNANSLMADVHDRMPVILSPEDIVTWLDPATPPATLLALLQPYPAEKMRMRPVSRVINRAGTDGAELIQAVPLNSA